MPAPASFTQHRTEQGIDATGVSLQQVEHILNLLRFRFRSKALFQNLSGGSGACGRT